jgi:hypothetical protein
MDAHVEVFVYTYAFMRMHACVCKYVLFYICMGLCIILHMHGGMYYFTYAWEYVLFYICMGVWLYTTFCGCRNSVHVHKREMFVHTVCMRKCILAHINTISHTHVNIESMHIKITREQN